MTHIALPDRLVPTPDQLVRRIRSIVGSAYIGHHLLDLESYSVGSSITSWTGYGGAPTLSTVATARIVTRVAGRRFAASNETTTSTAYFSATNLSAAMKSLLCVVYANALPVPSGELRMNISSIGATDRGTILNGTSLWRTGVNWIPSPDPRTTPQAHYAEYSSETVNTGGYGLGGRGADTVNRYNWRGGIGCMWALSAVLTAEQQALALKTLRTYYYI